MRTDWSPLSAWPDIPDEDKGRPLASHLTTDHHDQDRERNGMPLPLRRGWGDGEREREVAATLAAVRERAIANVAADPGVSPGLIRLWRASVALPAERHHVDCWYRLTRGAALCESGCAGSAVGSDPDEFTVEAGD